MTFNNNNIITFNKSENMNRFINPVNPVVTKILIHLPVVWFILGTIGFIGNTLTLLQSKLRSRTSSIYLYCSSIIDIITLSINLFLVYFLLIFNIGRSWFPFPARIISVLLVLFVLPHLSINFLVMAYFDVFASTCSPTSPLQRLNKFKMIPWMVSLIVICSCLALGYVPIMFIFSSQDEEDAERQIRILSLLYILTNGIIQPVIILVFILLIDRNRRKKRQQIHNKTTKNPWNELIIRIMAQVLTTAFFSLAWTCLFLLGIIMTDFKDLTKPMIYAIAISFYFYNLNNVKSFYVSLLISRTFRRTFIKVFIDLIHCRINRRMSTSNRDNSTRTRINNGEEIPLQPI